MSRNPPSKWFNRRTWHSSIAITGCLPTGASWQFIRTSLTLTAPMKFLFSQQSHLIWCQELRRNDEQCWLLQKLSLQVRWRELWEELSTSSISVEKWVMLVPAAPGLHQEQRCHAVTFQHFSVTFQHFSFYHDELNKKRKQKIKICLCSFRTKTLKLVSLFIFQHWKHYFWNTQNREKIPENHKFRVWKSRNFFSCFPSNWTSWDKYMFNGISKHKF